MRPVGAVAAFLVLATPAPAGNRAPCAPQGFYAGAGASFNWDRFDQSLRGVSGVTDVFIGPKLVADGQAGGPFYNYERDGSGFAPDFQLGYVTGLGGAWQAV